MALLSKTAAKSDLLKGGPGSAGCLERQKAVRLKVLRADKTWHKTSSFGLRLFGRPYRNTHFAAHHSLFRLRSASRAQARQYFCRFPRAAKGRPQEAQAP